MLAGPAWTDERVEMLKKLWADGLSASQIAGEIGGISRNSVIGKVHRLGLEHRGRPAGATRVYAPKIKAERKRTRGDNNVYGPRGARELIHRRQLIENGEVPVDQKLEVIEAEPAPPSFLGIALLDLEAHHCRYPRGGDNGKPILFCGQPKVEGLSYCASCASRCFTSARDVSDEESQRRSMAQRRAWAKRQAEAA